MSDSLQLYSPWNSPWNTEVGSPSLFQRTFPTQGSNPGLPYYKQILYQLGHKGSPRILKWVAYPFYSRSSLPRNRTRVSCIAGRFFTKLAIREALTKSRAKGRPKEPESLLERTPAASIPAGSRGSRPRGSGRGRDQSLCWEVKKHPMHEMTTPRIPPSVTPSVLPHPASNHIHCLMPTVDPQL